MDKQHVYVILGGIAMAAGLWWLLFSLPNQAAEEAGVTVQGTIVSAEVEEHMSTDNKDTYTPEITYRYSYDGQTYKNGNLEAGSGHVNYNDRYDAESIVDEYSEGTEVTVHVNSDDPSQSFLRPPTHGFWEYIMVFFPLLIAGLAAYAGIANS